MKEKHIDLKENIDSWGRWKENDPVSEREKQLLCSHVEYNENKIEVQLGLSGARQHLDSLNSLIDDHLQKLCDRFLYNLNFYFEYLDSILDKLELKASDPVNYEPIAGFIKSKEYDSIYSQLGTILKSLDSIPDDIQSRFEINRIDITSKIHNYRVILSDIESIAISSSQTETLQKIKEAITDFKSNSEAKTATILTADLAQKQ
ncbi:MAG: hypothetical protein GF404_01640 [candidate division Zixibacteria bacterium]|nr:hypothetical protein [candidate division Zixibacteria bacterium]